MDEEIEDLVGDLKYTDSQKSVTTSQVYSLDFTDSSSDKHNSSGKETYVIEYDDSDSEVYCLHENPSVINLGDSKLHREARSKINKSTSADFSVAQEIYTQTSKTILELAGTEVTIKNAVDSKTLQTQTSYISISENKTIEYRIHVSEPHVNRKSNLRSFILEEANNNVCDISCLRGLTTSLDDDSSKFPISESENETLNETDSENSTISQYDKIIEIIHDDKEDLRENLFCENKGESCYDNTTELDKSDTDLEEDSLMCYEYNENKYKNGDNTSETSEVPKSVDSDVEDLYKKLSEKIIVNHEKPREQEIPHYIPMSPLTEESVTVKTESIVDITPNCNNILDLRDKCEKYLVFTNSIGFKVKALPTHEFQNASDNMKLPPIKNNQFLPTEPRLNFLFSGNTRSLNNPYSLKRQKEWSIEDRWEIGSKDLAAGESPRIVGKSDAAKKIENISLPPIRAEEINQNQNLCNSSTCGTSNSVKTSDDSRKGTRDTISIKDKITELKMTTKNSVKVLSRAKCIVSTTDSKTSRSASPGSATPDECRLADLAERGCDILCVELLRRLRSNSWFEITDTLEEIPKVMDKFWGIITEQRIADLIRQVNYHVESARTQVARTACHTLSSILKNTNYTKKPDFYEAMMLLLVKTGSFSRPVRRAANVALDEIVSGVELAHSVTALCVHGVGSGIPQATPTFPVTYGILSLSNLSKQVKVCYQANVNVTTQRPETPLSADVVFPLKCIQ